MRCCENGNVVVRGHPSALGCNHDHCTGAVRREELVRCGHCKRQMSPEYFKRYHRCEKSK